MQKLHERNYLRRNSLTLVPPSPVIMVAARRTTRSDAQVRSKNATTTSLTPKAKGAAPRRQTKSKASNGATKNGEAGVNSKGKKRVKTDILSYLLSSHEAETDPNRDIWLLSFPTELFQEITSWLEPDALTCLSLTCKAILRIVGRDP